MAAIPRAPRARLFLAVRGDAVAESRANVDPVFEGAVRRLRDLAAAAGVPAAEGRPVQWDAPPLRDWSGDPADYEGMASPFDRSAANTDAAAATADPANPGTTGDLVASAAQAHYLGAMERAFRLRRLRGPRAAVQAASRRRGLGDDSGPLVGGVLEYVRRVLAEAKALP
jgi:hypothetical protein